MKTRNSHGLLQLQVGREALAYCQCLYRENKALFVSVDLIGENNQVILEYLVEHDNLALHSIAGVEVAPISDYSTCL